MSHKVKIFSHKRTDRFLPIHFFVHFTIFRQRQNIIRLADNIYPPTDSNLPLTELYNYAPLIGHEIPHERSPLESDWGIRHILRLSDPFVGSLQVKVLIFLCNSVKQNHMSHWRSTFNGYNFPKRDLWIRWTDIFLFSLCGLQRI